MKIIQDDRLLQQNNEYVISLNDIKVLREFGNKVLQCASIEEVSVLLFDLVEDNIKAQVCSLFLFLKNKEIERVSIRGKDLQGVSIDNAWLNENGRCEHYELGVSFSGNVLKPEEGSVYGKPILSNDIKKEYHPLKYCAEYEEKIGTLRNGISVPLNGTNRTFGTIEVINKIDGDFTQRDLCWLTIVGAHISSAISRLRKNKQEDITKYLINTLASNKNIGKRIDEIAKKIADFLVKENLTPYKLCTFRFIDNTGGGLMALAASSHSESEIPVNKVHFNRRVTQGLVGKVYRTKEPIEIEKIDDNIKLFVNRKWILDSKLKSFFCFPLIYQGRAIGTMSVFTGYEYELHDRDRKFLQEVALLVASCKSIIDNRERNNDLNNDLMKLAGNIQLSIDEFKQPIDRISELTDKFKQPIDRISELITKFKDVINNNGLKDLIKKAGLLIPKIAGLTKKAGLLISEIAGLTKKAGLLIPEITDSTKNIQAILKKKEYPLHSFYDFPYKAESLLLHELEIRTENNLMKESILLPMLLKIKNPHWQAHDIPDYQELYRSKAGSVLIVACQGSYKTVEALNEELDIISIGADHVLSHDDTDREN
jgi:GAF domain-containing protein